MASPSSGRVENSGNEPRDALVEIRGLTKLYPVKRAGTVNKQSVLSAVEDVDLDVRAGETLGLVGETGSGKSTLARLLVRLIEPTRGEVRYGGRSIHHMARAELRRLRRSVQIVFQDPYSSLNPRHTIGQIISEGISEFSGRQAAQRVADLLEMVALAPDVLRRYPHEFSGGQRQRICIARALAVNPKFLILDEPVSSLDVSVQAKILNLLRDLKENLNLTYLFISHDLGVVKHIADRVAVMYLGHLMEVAPKPLLFANPLHPYTQALLSAVPAIGQPPGSNGRIMLQGDIPSAIDIPARCRFAGRCFRPVDQSWEEVPPLRFVAEDHMVRCFNFAPLEQARRQ